MFTTSRMSLQTSLRWMRRAMTIILIVSNFATTMLADAAPVQTDTQPSFPIRAAFYYPWFPEAWNQQGFNPFTNYNPSLGFYDGGSQTVIKQQIAAMQYGGIQAGIASWWGQGSRTDSRISALLQAASGTSFRWSIYYENESQGDPSVAQITNDLTYMRDKYGNDPSFLRLNGRFVVFVYADGADACGMVDRWKQANTVGAYVVLKVFSGYRNCANQPDSWHQYSPAVAADSQKGFSYAIGPGFWKKGDAVRLARDLNRWNQNVRDMVASGAPFQLVTTFNEWGEGTSVESAKEWETSSGYGAYLDALHNNGNGGQAQPTATTVPATQTTQPTATNVPPTQTSQPTTIVLPTQTAQSTVTNAAPAQTLAATNVASPTSPAAPSATATTNPNTVPTSTSVPTFTASPIPSPTKTSTPITTGGDPIIAAAGDIACDPSDGNFNGGNGTSGSCRQKAVSDLFIGKNFSAVLALGDTQYEDGTLSKYQQSFDPSWGRAKNLIRPAVGNHEYLTGGASGYYNYFGAAAGDPSKGYYSYDIGAWHLIALNSNCSQVGGCGVGSPQEQWLKADLAAHPNACTLAYWHHPRFSSGEHGSITSYDAFWKDLYAAGADIVLNGHDHDYERFAPQNPSGAADPNGIQEFVVGTGGKNHYTFMTVQPNSLVRNSDTYGILKLTLHATSYDWQFVPEPGKTFTDSGTMNCRGAASTQPTLAATATKIPAPTNTPGSNPTNVASTPTNVASTPTTIGTNIPAPSPTQQSPSTPGTVSFAPIADAYVTSAIPNTNYGASKMIRFDASPVVNGYLTFNVQGLAGQIASAKLRVYANSSTSVGCKVYSVPDVSWGERTIIFNNAPALGNQIGSIGAFKGTTWVEVDVTTLVTGNGTFSMALAGINGTAVSLASRESGANAPQLVVNTLGSSTSATATGVPAPTQTVGATSMPTLALTATLASTQVSGPTTIPTQVLTATPNNPTRTPTTISNPTQTLTRTPTATLINPTQTRTPTASSTPASGSVVLVGAGDISRCDNNNDEAVAKLLDNISGTVFTAGDNAYDSGSITEYTNCYNPTWGRHQSRTKPVPGNHEYGTSGAAGYFQYFNNVPSYYAYNLGAWRIYALNSEIDVSASGAQVTWLQSDLAANPKACVLAYWHKPRWSSGTTHGSTSNMQPIWQILYNAGAELVVNGHEHNYERFAQMNASGAAVSQGMREIVAGTGGASHYGFGSALSTSEVRNSSTYGVLKLTLNANSYDWQFIPIAGSTFTDSGSSNCH